MKTGSIKFSLKSFSYNGVVISQWFEMEYKSQPTADKDRKEVEKTLDTLSLKKDLQTLILFLITFIIVLGYFNYLLDTYILNLISPPVSDSSQKNIFINILNLSLPKMKLLNQTLKLICDSYIKLSDFIEVI